jgi:PAS domain S-box-containing protein
MWVFDDETLAFLVVNQAACAHYGWSRDELLTMTIRDIRPPEDVASFEHGFAQAPKQPNARFSRATRHRTKDGRIIEVNLELRRLELGVRPATLVVVTDVTGIAEVERRFQLLVQHSADGIAITNEDNIVEYVSPGAERILGFSSGEVVGTSSTSRMHPDDLQAWTPPAPGETTSHVARVQHLDDSWRWIESATTNLTHDPAVRGFVSNYRDITARKTAEQALLEWQRRLGFLLSATSAITRTSRASATSARRSSARTSATCSDTSRTSSTVTPSSGCAMSMSTTATASWQGCRSCSRAARTRSNTGFVTAMAATDGCAMSRV